MKQRYHLFCPGPVNTAQNVKDALITYEIGHREVEFEQLFKRLQTKILSVWEVKHKKAYMPVIVTGSGTAANETVLSSIVGKKHILVLANGEFGDRLIMISKIHNPHTHALQFAWGEKIDLQKVEAYLKKHTIDVIAMVHHETSIGLLNPVAEIGELSRKYNLTYFIDTVSSAGADKIDLEKWNVAFCSTSVSKALSSFAGLGIIIGKITELEKLNDIPARTAYLNLAKFYEYAKKSQTPNTPAVQLFFALEKAMDNILKKGPVLHRKEVKFRAQMLRSEMKKLGLKFLIDEKDMSNSLTTVYLPHSMSFEKLCASLRRHHIIIYNGKGPFLNKVFQVANIGELSRRDVQFFIRIFRNVMDSKKHVSRPKSKLKKIIMLPEIQPEQRSWISRLPNPVSYLRAFSQRLHVSYRKAV